MSERLNKTSICSVIFVNITDYAQVSVADQIAQKERFNALINEAVKDLAQNDRIILDTAEGAVLALLGSPEEALFTALTIREAVLEDRQLFPERPMQVQIGINLGPVRVVHDLNGMLNVIGDGINAAQRVMSFAQPGQILVSRSYYEIVSRLSAEIADMFSYFGLKTDKYVREHEVYAVADKSRDAEVSPAVVGEATPAPRFLSSGPKLWAGVVAAVAVLAIALGVGLKLLRPVSSTAAGTAVATETGQAKAAVPAAAHPAKKQGAHAQSAGGKRKGSGDTCSDAQRMLKQC